jgi:hypothetical protein
MEQYTTAGHGTFRAGSGVTLRSLGILVGAF